MADVGIVYWSMYGATYALATAIAQGVEKAGGTPHLRRAADPLLPAEVKSSEGVSEAREAQAEVEEASVDEWPDFDGIVFGSPTRFGSAAAQLQNLFDQAGGLWAEGKLSGKAAGFFTGASSIHGGHESTIMSMASFAMHHGMVVVPAGYAIADELGSTTSGGGPYGPTHLGDSELTEDEQRIAVAYGEHFHAIAAKLADG